MALPPASQNPPSLSGVQIWFNGVTMGMGSNGVNLTEIDGLDLSAAWRTGDSGRPRDHGEFIGYDVLPGRDITVKFDVQGSTAAALGENMLAVSTATVPSGATESPLYIYTPTFGTLACMARPRVRSWSYNTVFDKGFLAQGLQMQFHATDPRFYSTPTTTTTIDIGTDAGTLTFPFTFPFSFGGGGDPSSATIVNSGNIDCRPIITINGPCDLPTIANGTISGVPSLNFDINLRAGNYLVIDTDLKSVLLVNSSGVAVPQSSLLSAGSQWWSLQPGANLIQCNIASTTGTPSFEIAWANAYLL